MFARHSTSSAAAIPAAKKAARVAAAAALAATAVLATTQPAHAYGQWSGRCPAGTSVWIHWQASADQSLFGSPYSDQVRNNHIMNATNGSYITGSEVYYWSFDDPNDQYLTSTSYDCTNAV